MIKISRIEKGIRNLFRLKKENKQLKIEQLEILGTVLSMKKKPVGVGSF